MSYPHLTYEDRMIITDALEAAEYWAEGAHGPLPVNDGWVYLPGDYGGAFVEDLDDLYWPEDREITDEEQEAIERVRKMRELAERLKQ